MKILPDGRHKLKRKFTKFMYDKLSQGMEIPAILTHFKSTLTNKQQQMIIQEIINDLNNNVPLALALKKTKLFNTFEINMLTAGIKGGILDLVLHYLHSLGRRKTHPSDLEKFSWVMGHLLASGVSIRKAIKWSAECVSSKKFKSYLLGLNKRKKGIFENLDKNAFPRWTRIILGLGELSGTIEESFFAVEKFARKIQNEKTNPPADGLILNYGLKHLESAGFSYQSALVSMLKLEFTKRHKDIIRSLLRNKTTEKMVLLH